jgi:hypothetical protein
MDKAMREHHLRQFSEARKAWGPGTEAYERRQKRKKRKSKKRKKNPSSPTLAPPTIPPVLIASDTDRLYENVSQFFDALTEAHPDRSLRQRYERLNDTHHPEMVALTFARADRLSNNLPPDDIVKRAATFASRVFGAPLYPHFVAVLPGLLDGTLKPGRHPDAISTDMAAEIVEQYERTGGIGSLKDLVARAVEEANRRTFAGPLSRRSRRKRMWELLWEITESDPDVISMRRPYQSSSRFNEKRGYFGAAPSPMSVPNADGTFTVVPEDYVQVYLLRIPDTNDWTLYFRTYCLDDEGVETVQRAYSLYFPKEAQELLRGTDSGVFFDEDNRIRFAGIESAVAVLAPILTTLGRLTYKAACSAERGAVTDLTGGEIPVGALLEGSIPEYASRRLENPSWLVPAASALVTAVGLGDSLYQLHSVLTR